MEDREISQTITEDTPLYSSNIIKTYLQLIRSRYPYVNVTELLLDAGMEAYQVEDEGHWFSQRQVDRFYDRLTKMTGNVNIAREAGRYTSSPDAIGKTARWALGFIDPANVYRLIGKIAAKYTRACSFDSRRLNANGFEMVVTPLPGVQEKQYQCENRKGYFEAVVKLFHNTENPQIEHTECQFQGGSCCRYTITWRWSTAETLKKVRNITALLSIVGAVLAGFYGTMPFFRTTVIAAFSAVIILSLITEILEKREIRSALINVRSTTEELLDNATFNYNQALMINEIGQIISLHNQVGTLLSQVAETLRNRLDYDRALIMLVSEDGKNLEYKAGYGYSDQRMAEIQKARFHLDRPDSRGVFVLCYRERRPFLIDDVETIEEDLSLHSLDFLKSLGTKSFICCPILYRDECLGVLAVDNMRSKRPLLESDKNLLMGIAPELGVSVRNALMAEERETQFKSILRVLAASIDARDSLTAGHSERVTEYSVLIGRELGLPDEYMEVVRVAAQLHDYGKIGVADSVLKKGGPLTKAERRAVETHAAKTRSILDRVDFKGIYREVPTMAGAHHEWMDGTGYPDGLKGSDIPLGSRIIAVADFYEAITAERHYRNPMDRDEARRTIEEAAGSHLDPVVVEAFLRVLERIQQAARVQEAGFRPQHAITGV